MLSNYTCDVSKVAPMFAIAIDRDRVDNLPPRIFYRGRNIHGYDTWCLDLAGAKHLPRDKAEAEAARLGAVVVSVPDWIAYG